VIINEGLLMRTILVTNDDGYDAPSLPILVKTFSKTFKVLVSVPHNQMSGSGKSIEYHKPLRVSIKNIPGSSHTYVVKGSPALAVLYGRSQFSKCKLDLVVSGINSGLNVSLYNALTSGTFGAAVEAALWGIPAISASIQTGSTQWFNAPDQPLLYEEPSRILTKLCSIILDNGIPQDVDLLNINFPAKVDSHTEIIVTKMNPRRFIDSLILKKDAYGEPYYWIGMGDEAEIKDGSDLDAVVNKEAISITPIVIKLVEEKQLHSTHKVLRSYFPKRMQKLPMEHD